MTAPIFVVAEAAVMFGQVKLPVALATEFVLVIPKFVQPGELIFYFALWIRLKVCIFAQVLAKPTSMYLALITPPLPDHL